MGSRRGQSFSVELHTTVFQADIYAIKACVMENPQKGYRVRNIYIFFDSQAAIKALEFADKLQIRLGMPSILGETGRP